MPVAEIFLKGFLDGLVGILTSQEFLNFALRENFHDLLIKWKEMLEQINAVLVDAEEKQIRTDQRGVHVWLEHLEDLAYDMDDILDEISTEALRQNVLKEARVSTSKVSALIHTSITHLNPRTIYSDFRMRSKMDKITKRLKDLFDQRMGLRLQNVIVGPSAQAPQRPHTSPLSHETPLYSRDGDKRKIIELLMSDQSGAEKVCVVPIVGLPGVGKTTLAQHVYKDEIVGKHFETKVWVCVSDVFDILAVTKAILESVTSEPCRYNELELVQPQLKEVLDGKKFLIVLDDVWNKKHSDWINLRSPFNDGAYGSKIMVTTRDKDVAEMMAGIDKFHSLGKLSDDDCWPVFAQYAFANRSLDESPNLVSIGRKIVQKCGGLPLAARTLGGLLRWKSTDREWEDVLQSKIWLSDKEGEILPALRLSYYHLPSHLKKCFEYCSVLPKGYEFKEKELVLWWIAEGLIQKPAGQKQMEDVGCEYFQELLSRSLFQSSSSGEASRFVMHDLINDLAQFVARRICFRMEEKLEDNEGDEIITKARHSSYTRGIRDGIKKFEAFQKTKNVRSFLPFGVTNQGPNEKSTFLTSYVPLHLLPKLRRLRVLSLRRYLIYELSSSIGDLKHLRFLDLSYALFATLPESIGTLYNLQTLILEYCHNLSKLPTTTSNLINLRHLNVTGADSLQEMPQKIGKLTSLQTLSNFVVSQGGGGSNINELGNLIHLKGTLSISGLENVTGAMDAMRANLDNKEGLDVLLMKWSDISDNSHNGSIELEVLDMLRPHKNLKELTIVGYHGVTFPTWVGSAFFCNIVSLKFHYCKQCISLPSLGQLPWLKKLYIQGMKAVENFGPEFYGSSCSNPFPSLQILTLMDMPELKEWSPFGVEEGAQAFVHLSKLSIERCPKLLGTLPSNLPCLKMLKIEECPLLVVAWVSRPIELNAVRNTLHFDLIISLSLKDVSFPDFFGNPEAGDDVVVDARYSHLSLLTSLRVENIQGLTSLPNLFFQCLIGLQEISICGCKDLTSLWKREVRMHNFLPAVERLVIEGCPRLISLFEEEEEEGEEGEGIVEEEGGEEEEEGEEGEGIVEEEGREEEEEQLNQHEELPRGSDILQSLKVLIIHDCPCLISLPKTGLPSTLTNLKIYNCDTLQSLPELNSLQNLRVWKCSSLKYLSCSRTGLPPTLECLHIENCGNLESILAEEGMKINCPRLKDVTVRNCQSLKSLPDVMQNDRNGCELDITNCANLESIPEGWFSATNLTSLSIFRLKKLKVLPHHASNNNIHNHLTCLQYLGIDSCSTGVASYVLKEESFSYLTNLTCLHLLSVDMGNKPPSEWGLYRFSSLRKLKLESYNWASFPPEEKGDGMMSWLPRSLNNLVICDFPNLVKLSCKNFQNPPSLKQLEIQGCFELTTITELGQLPSLSKLIIEQCPKLASFSAKEKGLRLPPSLLMLDILLCPKLKQRCEKGKGKYWPLISHIPQLAIDGAPFFTVK